MIEMKKEPDCGTLGCHNKAKYLSQMFNSIYYKCEEHHLPEYHSALVGSTEEMVLRILYSVKKTSELTKIRDHLNEEIEEYQKAIDVFAEELEKRKKEGD